MVWEQQDQRALMSNGGGGAFSLDNRSNGQAVWEQKWKVGWMPGNRALTAEWAGVGWAMGAYRPLSISVSQGP